MKQNMFSRHSEMPLFLWHKQDNMLAPACDKMKPLRWILFSKWFTVPWAFNQCYFSSEICNGMHNDTFYSLFLMSEKLREWRRKANHYQKMACWVRCREGVCALSNSRPGTKISSNAALSLSVMSTLECTDYGWNSREIQTVLAVSNRTET